jgi:transposase-like protein
MSMKPDLKVDGRWCYVYRTFDRSGALVDVLFNDPDVRS